MMPSNATPRRSLARFLKRAVRSRITLGVLLILVLLLGRAVWNVGEKAFETGAARQKQAAELAQLEERRAQLQQELERLGTRRGIEAEVRESYGMAKPGEEVLVFVESPTSSTKQRQPERSWWQRLGAYVSLW